MAVVEITLNKAFGFGEIDADVLPLLFAAAAIGTIDVPVKDRGDELQACVRLGHYGTTQAEKQGPEGHRAQVSHADQDLLSDGRKVFEIRNGLAHGQKRSVSRAEVKTVLGIIHRFRELFGRP
jgi:hypothetical protein